MAAASAPRVGMEPDPLKVFISYSRKDRAAADAIVAMLDANGFETMIDRRDLPYGEEWQGELADFITSADEVIWLVSPHSVASKWCNWELDEVHKQNKRLVPVRVGAVEGHELPRQLGRVHILPVEGAFDMERDGETLREVLRTDHGWLKEHTRLLDRARQWALKDRGDGLLLRGRALKDAEVWQLQQPASAPSPSAEVLDLILQSRKGAQSRLRRLVGGLAAGLVVALALAALAYWQSVVADEARALADERRAQWEAEARRVLRTTALSGWRAFEEPKQSCLEMREYTGEEGLVALYCHVRDILSYGKLEELAGMKAFVSGPHSDGKLRIQEDTFGHYNPAMVAWVRESMVPAPDDVAYLAITQPVYDRYIKRMARAYQRAYVAWSHNLAVFLAERAYLSEMIEGTRPWSYMGARFQEPTMRDHLGIDPTGEDLNWYHLDTALRYWQRRSLDGTAREVFALLEDALAVYDPEFLARAPRPAAIGLPTRFEDVEAAPGGWMPRAPSGGNLKLNSVVVVE